jgi:sec-independent protein translocase protein TatB
MFDIGFSEIIIIAIIAVIFLGPDKLPEAMVKVARFFKDLKRVVNDARSSFEEEVRLKELKEEALYYKQSLKEAANDISGFKNAIPNPIEEVNKTLQEARRDMISLDEVDEEFKNISKDDSKKSQETPTEFKNLKRGDV